MLCFEVTIASVTSYFDHPILHRQQVDCFYVKSDHKALSRNMNDENVNKGGPSKTKLTIE